MGQTILTSKQLDFLECVSDEKQIIKRFYLTGGTALAEFYKERKMFKEEFEGGEMKKDPYEKSSN